MMMLLYSFCLFLLLIVLLMVIDDDDCDEATTATDAAAVLVNMLGVPNIIQCSLYIPITPCNTHLLYWCWTHRLRIFRERPWLEYRTSTWHLCREPLLWCDQKTCLVMYPEADDRRWGCTQYYCHPGPVEIENKTCVGPIGIGDAVMLKCRELEENPYIFVLIISIYM